MRDNPLSSRFPTGGSGLSRFFKPVEVFAQRNEEDVLMLDTVDRILDFAIKQEESAAQLYRELSKRVMNENMKEAFLQFAREEDGHKAKLLNIKSSPSVPEVPKTQIVDLKIADHLADTSISPDMSYGDALVLLMKAEKNAYQLYTKLASTTDDPDLKKVLLVLAQEEANHKLRFEIEYDEEFLKEN